MTEPTIGTTRWKSVQKLSPAAFLAAGILLVIATVVVGLEWLGGMEGLSEGPLAFAGFIGLIVAYIGLLTLYPRLVDGLPRLARAILGLLFVPVAVILVDLLAVAFGFDPPFAGRVAAVAFLVFAVGIALIGIASLRTRALSRSVGLSLLVFAIAWFLLLGEGLLYGFPTSDPVTFVTTGLMAGALLAVGYLLRTETEPTGHTEPAPPEAQP